MTEWGVFNDEGLLEGDHWSREQAEQAIAERYEPEDEATAEEVCGECRGGRADAWHEDCPAWANEDEEDEE